MIKADLPNKLGPDFIYSFSWGIIPQKIRCFLFGAYACLDGISWGMQFAYCTFIDSKKEEVINYGYVHGKI